MNLFTRTHKIYSNNYTSPLFMLIKESRTQRDKRGKHKIIDTESQELSTWRDQRLFLRSALVIKRPATVTHM